ncbi:hypothetical protein HN681_00435 [archaeon]|jgi:programmed cell death protein 5|nr:hypothetical protein [archaeon]MBT3730748.1 hypothetical protein [archaeon]MBT4669650.1 hypothetical protein [archaeon]MBT5030407.1 hypothetical protein [archaeon]MBT5288300.1 hypothetical protein [archaeon]
MSQENHSQTKEKLLKQKLEELEKFVKQYLSAEAVTRYGNLKTVHPEKAVQSLIIIAEMAQEGRLNARISDSQYKALLVQMRPKKKEFKVKRK